jgi:hypothetical protein
VHRRDVDDPPETLLVHVRERGLGEPERGFKHHGKQQPERVQRELVDRSDILQARAVHQDVGVAGQRSGVEVGGQVDFEGAPGDGRGDRDGRAQVDVGDHHAGAALGQPDRAGRADPARTAGDHGQPPGKILAHVSPALRLAPVSLSARPHGHLIIIPNGPWCASQLCCHGVPVRLVPGSAR